MTREEVLKEIDIRIEVATRLLIEARGDPKKEAELNKELAMLNYLKEITNKVCGDADVAKRV